ncbi:TerB family tellurite resistance protein [Christiangramia forsetii]|uniref:Uncharacterized protein n=2 Tax=Christiangramia forsetii TaxID=411153 RepID=A0LZY6_CHRFK|nr:TerB family tellurite resistance protein [Christiangramia forsetii]GGG45629.1 hypothetical protein GCM10011532_31990 [Christiangramia forsetii]CAL65931.1 hypothetical protein GFO_0957 [Christiangramia forsetii KT0803]
MEFNLAEKLAIVKAIDRVILADNKVANAEMAYLGQLMELLNFDSDFVEEARKFNVKQANGILENMGTAKKHSLAIILHEMAYADGEMDKEEIKVLFTVFENAGIKIEKSGNTLSVFDISDIYFKSSRHYIHSKDQNISESYSGEKRAIKIEPNIEGKKGYSVTSFFINGMSFLWGKKVEMSPKQMEVVQISNNKVLLRGYDDLNIKGEKHSNYSISIFHNHTEVEKIIIHHHNENIDVEYLK